MKKVLTDYEEEYCWTFRIEIRNLIQKNKSNKISIYIVHALVDRTEAEQ